MYGIRASSLRLTNTYGPRQLIKHNRQGFIGWFVRKASLGEEIQLFGDGQQLRDFNYVDDVVDAFLLAGASRLADGQVFNLGASRPPRLCSSSSKLLVELAGQAAPIASCPFPADRKRIDIGDFYADTERRSRATLGLEPAVPLREGLAAPSSTTATHREHYL